MARETETERVRRYWEKAARSYDRSAGPMERSILGDGRAWLGRSAEGDVLEVGVGTGLSLEHYPPGIRLTAIELSPAMLERAKGRADELGLTADLRIGDAQRLPFPDASFDTVAFSLVLCAIPDHVAAIREARRVLRPGGRVVALEHVRSPNVAVRIGQRLIEVFTSRLQADHMLRDPEAVLRDEGFAIETSERSRLGIIHRIAARAPTSD